MLVLFTESFGLHVVNVVGYGYIFFKVADFYQVSAEISLLYLASKPPLGDLQLIFIGLINRHNKQWMIMTVLCLDLSHSSIIHCNALMTTRLLDLGDPFSQNRVK